MATGLVALSGSTAVLAWPRRFRLLHDSPGLPRVSGKNEGSALQKLKQSACVPKDSSLQNGQALHVFCMVSAPHGQSFEDCAVPWDSNAHLQAADADAIPHGVSYFASGTG